MFKAYHVIDLGFGDSGKGLVTNYLCQKYIDFSTIVIRFSGGQQAGHTVIYDDKKHISSNFGSGVLNYVPTYITEDCTIYPNTISRERIALHEKGIFNPQLTIHPLARLTTPSDVAYNRILEKRLKHGSCGFGVGATMSRHEKTGYKTYAIDINTPSILFAKMVNISKYYCSLLISEKEKKDFIEIEQQQMDYFKIAIKELFDLRGYDFLKNYQRGIFEGSQGILLDMDHGIFPNVTYANTTSKNAMRITNLLGVKEIETFYVTRCYQNRHGAGWISNERKIELVNNSEEINVSNEWQGEFRTVELDYDLLNYSLEIDELYTKSKNKNLVVTCLDQRPGFEFDYTKIKPIISNMYESKSPISKDIIRLKISLYPVKINL